MVFSMKASSLRAGVIRMYRKGLASITAVLGCVLGRFQPGAVRPLGSVGRDCDHPRQRSFSLVWNWDFQEVLEEVGEVRSQPAFQSDESTTGAAAGVIRRTNHAATVEAGPSGRQRHDRPFIVGNPRLGAPSWWSRPRTASS